MSLLVIQVVLGEEERVVFIIMILLCSKSVESKRIRPVLCCVAVKRGELVS